MQEAQFTVAEVLAQRVGLSILARGPGILLLGFSSPVPPDRFRGAWRADWPPPRMPWAIVHGLQSAGDDPREFVVEVLQVSLR